MSRILSRKPDGGEENKWENIRQKPLKVADFAPVDGANKWLLRVSVEVAEEKAGPLKQRGTDELLKVKRDLSKLYDFETFDRDVFDTRVPECLANARKQRMKF